MVRVLTVIGLVLLLSMWPQESHTSSKFLGNKVQYHIMVPYSDGITITYKDELGKRQSAYIPPSDDYCQWNYIMWDLPSGWRCHLAATGMTVDPVSKVIIFQNSCALVSLHNPGPTFCIRRSLN